jgi:hypothetical protein
MRLGIQMLESSGPNQIKTVANAFVRQGDATTIYFQLMDLTTGNRYIPATGAIIQVSIPRLPIVSGSIMNTRQVADHSLNRSAYKPFSGDWSIWALPLSSADTLTLTSGSIVITMTEGISVLSASNPLALSVSGAGGL